MLRRAATLALLATTLTAASAEAAGQEGARPGPVAPQVRGYALQILLADAGAVGLGLLASRVTVTPWPLALYAVTGPLLHTAHRQPDQALRSLGVRVALPIAGAVAGRYLDRRRCASGPGAEPCGRDRATLGLVAGALAATIIDAAVLARVASAPPPSGDSSPAMQPALVVGAHGGPALAQDSSSGGTSGTASPSSTAPRLSPAFGLVARGGGTLGIAGTF